MKTLKEIRTIFTTLIESISKNSTSGHEYLNACREYTNEAIKQLTTLANTDAVLCPINLPSEKGNVFSQIKSAKNRCVLNRLPISSFRDTIQGKTYYTPAFLSWQEQGNKQKNFIINYEEANKIDALKVYRNIVMNILLAFPPHSVHLTFVNLQLSPDAGFFTGSLNESFYSMITNQADYQQLLQSLRERMVRGMSKYGGSLESYNESNQTLAEPYEIIILLDDPDSEVNNQEQLIPLFEKGSAYGIYFIGLNDTTKNPSKEDTDHILKHTMCYHSIDPSELNLSFNQTDGVTHTISFANDPNWAKAAFAYLNGAETQAKEKAADWDSMAADEYADASNGEISAPIGVSSDGQPVNFRMNVTDHVHGFVIGKTGSGKSRFLHAIIMSMISKYSPEDLELYLMDFKGVEFSCYKEIKHVRSLLVDRADELITCEVFRDIRQKMNERVKLIRDTNGSPDLAAYNKLYPDRKLPQIILIIDECQTLFADRAQNSKLQNEVVDIIAEIAQQGRSNGVHMLLATHSLDNTPQLTVGTFNQINEHYILPCSTRDATRIVDDMDRRATEEAVAKMQKGRGDCFYQGSEKTFFTFNYIAAGEMQEKLLQAAIAKTEGHKSNGQVYFSGSLQFSLNQESIDFISSKGRNNIVASMGQEISLTQTPLAIPLKDDLSENILLMGINDTGEPVTRTSMNALVSLMATNKVKGLGYKFIVFDCLDDEEANYIALLDGLSNAGLCQVIAPRNRGSILKKLCEDIQQDKSESTILFILGQERFRELKLNNDLIPESAGATSESPMDAIAMMNAISFNSQADMVSSIKTFDDAINYILENGPEHGVHVVMQLDKVEHFMFPQDGYVNRKNIFSKFKHLIVLRSEDRAASALGLADDVRLERLSSDELRLRAYYYNEEKDSYALFTPFMLPTIDIINTLK